MALYSVNNVSNAIPAAINISSTAKTILSLTAQTIGLRRAYIYEFEVGADGVPNATDCAIVWDLALQTTLGTGVSMTITPLDVADAASTSVGTGNYTIEPTIAANVSSRWVLAANQRASYRWVVNPGGPGEIIVPATNVNGYALRAKSTTYASTTMATMFFRE
jgi:hypothetical protein